MLGVNIDGFSYFCGRWSLFLILRQLRNVYICSFWHFAGIGFKNAMKKNNVTLKVTGKS